MIHINNILKLLDFEDLDVKKVDLDSDEHQINIHISLNVKPCKCPKCGAYNTTIHSHKLCTIIHKHFSGKECLIYYNKNRLRCKSCGKTYLEPNPFAKFQTKISDETVFFVLKELKQIQSFNDVAKKAGISTTEAIRIFDKHVQMNRLKLPRILGIDEFKNLRNGSGKYACILTSIDNKAVIDIIKDRLKDTLSSYFSKISRKERQNVKYFVSDMYDGYKYIKELYFPNAIHIVDTFHFVKLITEAFNIIRIKIMKTYSCNSNEYSLLKKYWKTLCMPSYKLHEKETYYSTFRRYMNQIDLLKILLKMNDDLLTAYMIKDNFLTTYCYIKESEAENYINNLIKELDKSGFEEYKKAAGSLRKWKVQIINSFSRNDKNKRITNAKTEGFNNSVKVIKRASYGYANFERFRNRILYILRDKTPIKI